MDILFRKRKQAALVNALIQNDPAHIETALEKLKNVDFVVTHPNFTNHTPLSMMVAAGCPTCVQLLLERGANPNQIVFKNPLWSDVYSENLDLLPSSVLYMAVSNGNLPDMQQVYNLLRDYNADMFCNKDEQSDFGFINSRDDVHYSVRAKLEKSKLLEKWQQWENDYQSLRINKVLHKTIGDITVSARKSKM